MKITRLTKPEIDKAAHKADGPANQFLWETSTPGFGVQLLPSGRKSFVVSAQLGENGKVIRRKIGDASHLDATTITEARKSANKWLTDIRDGFDPAKQKRAAAKTIREAVAEYAEDNRKRLKPGSLKAYDEQLPLWLGDVVKRFGNDYLELESWLERPVFSLRLSEIRERHAAIGHRHAHTANQVMRGLRAVLNDQLRKKAEEQYDETSELIIPQNPVSLALHKRWFPERPRRRVLREKEIRQLLTLLDAWEGNKLYPSYVRLQLWTGLRVGEVASLRWDYVESDRIVIPNTKNDVEHEVPIVGQVAAELDYLRAQNEWYAHSRAATEWLFPSHSASGRLTAEQYPLEAVQAGWTGKRFRAHDLRRTFRSVAMELGASDRLADILMNHKIPGVDAHYAFPDKRRWLAKIDEYLTSLISKKKKAA